jgi:hypothetical protein
MIVRRPAKDEPERLLEPALYAESAIHAASVSQWLRGVQCP